MKRNAKEDYAKVQAVPRHLRTSLESLSAATGIPKTALDRIIKRGVKKMDDTIAMAQRPDKPKRPLTAFNLFFKLEREYLYQNAPGYKDDDNDNESTDDDNKKACISDVPLKYKSIKLVPDWYTNVGKSTKKRKHRKSNGKIGFVELIRLIQNAWATIDTDDPETKEYVTRIAARGKEEYKLEVKQFKESMKLYKQSMRPPPKKKKQSSAECGLENKTMITDTDKDPLESHQSNPIPGDYTPNLPSADMTDDTTKYLQNMGRRVKIVNWGDNTGGVATKGEVGMKQNAQNTLPTGQQGHQNMPIPGDHTPNLTSADTTDDMAKYLQNIRRSMNMNWGDNTGRVATSGEVGKKQNAQDTLPTGQQGNGDSWLWV